MLSSSVGVLDRSLKKIPFSIILFYHAFIGVFINFLVLFVAVAVDSRPLYFLDFSPYQNTLLFGATVLGALALMT